MILILISSTDANSLLLINNVHMHCTYTRVCIPYKCTVRGAGSAASSARASSSQPRTPCSSEEPMQTSSTGGVYGPLSSGGAQPMLVADGTSPPRRRNATESD